MCCTSKSGTKSQLDAMRHGFSSEGRRHCSVADRGRGMQAPLSTSPLELAPLPPREILDLPLLVVTSSSFGHFNIIQYSVLMKNKHATFERLSFRI